MREYSLIPQIIKKVIPAVVSINASKFLAVAESPFSPSPFDFEQFFSPPKPQKKVEVGGGSGFIVDPSGIVLTNRHVVEDPEAKYIAVLNNDKRCKIRILAKDPINDIAVLKIEEENLPVIELGDSLKLELGQTAIAIGNTLGMFRNTISVGVISGLSRYITAFSPFDNQAQTLRGLIQTDAAINPGNSGGPLISIDGKVIGINAAMIFGMENVGFALPINTAKDDLEEVKKYGRIRQPFFGVRYILLNKDLQKKYGFPVNYGALVVSEDAFEGLAVIPGSPAEKAGIKESDVILEVGAEKISLKNPLKDILQKIKIGQVVQLKVLREGREILCKAAIEEME